MSRKIADGEYVLGTRFSDGDPMDAWAFGFLARVHDTWNSGPGINKRLYCIVDSDGSYIGKMYRRVQRISKEFGDFLAENIEMVESSRHSLWWWKNNWQKVEDCHLSQKEQ